MAGKGPSHAPLSYRDHLKIREATKYLHSRFVSVRNAAAKEIQRILARRQQARGRLDPKRWARQAWERVHHGKKHECGNCEYGTRDRAMLRKHQEAHMREAGQAVRTGPAATPGLRERQADQGRSRGHVRDTSPGAEALRRDEAMPREERREEAKRTRTQPQDVRAQAGLLPQDQKRQQPAARPAPGVVTNASLRQEARDRRAAARPGSEPPTMGQQLIDEARRQGKHGLAEQMEASGWGIPVTDSQMRDLDRKEALARAGRHDEAAQIGRKIAGERTAAKAERAPTRSRSWTSAGDERLAPPAARSSRAPAAPAHSAAPVRTPPLPHETVRAPRTPKTRLRMPRLRARA